MKVNVDLESLVAYADDVRMYEQNMWKTRIKHGYKRGFTYWGGTVKEIDDAYEWSERARHALSAICDVTDVDWEALMQMSRIVERYYDSRTYQNLGVCLKRADFERMYETLTSKEPEYGSLYHNEYADRAICRLGWQVSNITNALQHIALTEPLTDCKRFDWWDMLIKKVMHGMKKNIAKRFWEQVDAFINPECFAPGTFKRSTYLELYAVMYDNGWLSEDDLAILDWDGLPTD